MTVNGIISISIWFTVIILILIFHKFFKKLLKHNFFWIGFSLIWLVYFLVGRYVPLIIASVESNSPRLIQNIILTDFCPFFALVVPILCIFKKSRRFAAYFAGWGLFSSHVTAYQIFFAAPNQDQLRWWNWIFYAEDVGSVVSANGLFFMTHLMIAVFSILLIIEKAKLGFRYWFWNFWVMAFYVIYVSIFKYSLNLSHNTTGIGIEDWDVGGQYNIVSQVLGIPVSIVWPVGYIISVAANFLLCVIFIISKNNLWRIKEWNIKKIKSLFRY